jgi:hypothetical protein
VTVSLVEIFAAARAHAAPMAAESAGYLLLAIADHVASAQRVVQPDEVELASDGSVRLRPRRGSVAECEGAEAALRRLLSRALELAGSTGPALRRAADRREDVGLPALVRELEVALIPVNRAAAKRALSRLHRETERARDAGKLESWLRAEQALPVAVPAEPSASPVPVSEPVAATPQAETAPPPPCVRPAPSRPAPAPTVELTLTPEPRIAVGEPALTKPEPVVLRARERGSATPRLGTVVTAQTLENEEADRTERAPEVAEELELIVEVELLAEPEPEPASEPELELEPENDLTDEVTPALPSKGVAVAEPLAPQPWLDPEPSILPDVLGAMVELHTGFDIDEAPTRLREVVTELLPEAEPPLEPFEMSPSEQAPEALPFPLVSLVSSEPWVTPEPEEVEDTWLTASSLAGVVSVPTLFVSERAAPELHEALTWDPGPVVCSMPSPPPPALFISAPALEPSPYAPAVLPALRRDVSELLDSFHVSGAAEEQELCSALKDMAGLELTPMPRPAVEER